MNPEGTSPFSPAHLTPDTKAAHQSCQIDSRSGEISFQNRQTPHLRLNSGTENVEIDGELVTESPACVTDRASSAGDHSSLRGSNDILSLHKERQDISPISTIKSGTTSLNGLVDEDQDVFLPQRPRKKARVKHTLDHKPRTRLRSSKALPRKYKSNRPNPNRETNDSGFYMNGFAFSTQSITHKFNFVPSAEVLISPQDIEKDDHIHDISVAEEMTTGCNLCTRRPFLKIAGLTLIALGVLIFFVAFPAVTFVKLAIDSRLTPCEKDPDCISDNYPPLVNIKTTVIDPDTPNEFRTKTAHDGRLLKLAFSDEFNTPGRSFYPDDDPFFEAVDIWYGVTEDLEWYDPDAISTADGTLNIQFDAYQNHNLSYRSGMLQSWNKFCFKGGHVEASISLPGSGSISGFWPGFWAMGNLGRPGYASTTDGMWPYSYWDKCDAGIMKNQSSPDGLSFLPGMKLPACTCPGEDHPSPGKSRSAPEIDAIEASVGWLGSKRVGTASQSAQIAPFDTRYRPNYDFVELFDPNITHINNYRGGPFQETLSGLSNLDNGWYNGDAYQTYAFEYVPGDKGHIIWYIGDTPTWRLDARAIGPHGNIGQRIIPAEPMALVVNLGMSPNFAWIDYKGMASQLPAVMRVDYIRIYQDEDGILGCNPPGYPTTEYIASHPESYMNVNKTLWYVLELCLFKYAGYADRIEYRVGKRQATNGQRIA